MGIRYNHTGKNKNYSSKSGWENSWYGGYSQMIWDHPSISLHYKVSLDPSKGLRKKLGYYAAEKIIKILILKAVELKLIDNYKKIIVVRKNFSGIEKKYQQIIFDDKGILRKIMKKYGEIAPLFEHYEGEILLSFAEIEIDKEEQEGEEQEGEGQEGEGQEGRSSRSYIGNVLLKTRVYSRRIHNNLSKYENKPEYKKIQTDGVVHRFTQSEISNAEHLVKLLDISFEPKSDVVKSLRLGKLDTAKIAEVPAGNTSIYKRTVEEQDTRPFTVCILADMSGSMSGDPIRTQLHVLNSLYLAMIQILPEDKLFIYGHTGEASPDIYTFYSPYEQNYEERIAKYESIRLQQNYDGPVIEELHKKIRSITDDRVIFISLSDGEPCGNSYGGDEDNLQLKQILEKCRRDEFVTVGIGILSDHVKELYTYSKVIEHLEYMAKDISGIINRVVKQEFK